MTRFERAILQLPPVREFIAQCMAAGSTRHQAKMAYRQLKADVVWKNDTYQVNIDTHPPHGFPFAIAHLSIKRIDKQPIHDWRDLQQIKNELCGEEREAIELYPAESRIVDTANQYHLWVLPAGVKVPCGWSVRTVTDNPGMNAVQRPRAVAT